VNLFSDLLLHDMGDTLADGVSQGLAGPSEFRTAPLWGLGQRVFFLHDGRTSDLVHVIRLHGGSESEARVSAEQFFWAERFRQAGRTQLPALVVANRTSKSPRRS